jgi:hypothetical protein
VLGLLRLVLGERTLLLRPELGARTLGLPEGLLGERVAVPVEVLGPVYPVDEVRGMISGVDPPVRPALLRGATSCLPPLEEPELRAPNPADEPLAVPL